MKLPAYNFIAIGMCAVLLCTAFLQHREIVSLRQEMQECLAELDRLNEQTPAPSEEERIVPENAPLTVRFQNAQIQPEARRLSVDLAVELPEELLSFYETGLYEAGLCMEGEPYALAWNIVLLSKTGDGSYEGTLTLPLEPDRNLDIRLKDDTVLFSGPVRSLLPVQRSSDNGYGCCSWHYDAQLETFFFCDPYAGLTELEGNEVQVENGAFRVCRNGEQVFYGREKKEIARLESNGELYDGVSIPCRPGDHIRIDYTFQDETGLVWTFPLEELEALSWDDMRRCPLSGLPLIVWPE